ncbi:cyclic lactone autoinducer peptide [Candidatus Contubernalis alkalaceticus]|nr:cyclic lactone autoinducer peptide [Candidatus Contubernalis alkalaceticus]
MKSEKTKTMLQVVCRLLLLTAPLILSGTACLGFWGEPEIPESLK